MYRIFHFKFVVNLAFPLLIIALPENEMLYKNREKKQKQLILQIHV